jgi:hypothetical protein
MEWEVWDRPHRWRYPAPDRKTLPVMEAGPETGNDEFGFSLSVFGRFPRIIRYYLSIAYDYANLDKRQTPSQQGLVGGDRGVAGTVPEMVFFGMLLDAGFRISQSGFFGKTPRSFLFQSRLLGGRVPGGAVSDFVVFINGRTIAVRIHSVFHEERNPFGSGGAKSEEDKRQRIKLRSAGYLDNVVDVNRASDGLPLENGPAALVRNDLRRVMNA